MQDRETSKQERVESVVEETVHVAKREVERERVRVTISPETREEVIDVPLVHQTISVQRVPIGREVESTEGPRREGSTLVVPVYEEVLVVHKKLVLREEVRITLEREEKREPQRVELRREEARIERLPPAKER